MSGAPAPASACDRAQTCERTVARMLSACITRVGAKMKRCYLEHGAACPPGESHTADILAAVDTKIRARCPDAAMVQAIGYGASATPAT
jgi:hypothetical protein